VDVRIIAIIQVAGGGQTADVLVDTDARGWGRPASRYRTPTHDEVAKSPRGEFVRDADFTGDGDLHEHARGEADARERAGIFALSIIHWTADLRPGGECKLQEYSVSYGARPSAV